MLLFQIYSHHKNTVEATRISPSKSCDEYNVGDRTCMNNQISENETGNQVLDRPKRPFRLLPLNNNLYVIEK